MLIAGDFCPNYRISEMIEKGNFEGVFGDMKNILAESDYSIVNFESTILKEQSTDPIDKCGPNLKQNSNVIESLKYAGFNAVTLANNHFSDFGHSGVLDTIEAIKNAQLDYVGGGINKEDASKILYKQIDYFNIAFINICENEFTIATENEGGANPLNPVINYYQIAEAHKNADFVIVIIHGGPEHYQLPTPRMKETYKFFIDSGADVIINHHQHCYSGYEIYRNKPIFYGIGNFSFDSKTKQKDIWYEGFVVLLKFQKESIDFQLIPYFQGRDNPGISLMKDAAIDKFFSNVEKLNSIISAPDQLNEHYNQFIEETYMDYICNLNPYQNNFLRKLVKKGILPKRIADEILPDFWTKDRMLNMISFFQCESHNERCLKSLRFHYKKVKKNN